ncbi:hypothetical protein PV371_36930 [Streptomyces sp. TX20-6-3]|uniref:hypothetical protein n=1 Tax=Streptomyces sp. TX20-6-3 TaxID=3028705 RepID=UPI0029BAF122|nr:hypothetical protein [Streptomyces sp. TX20-6-3]MDX2565204.1 hypothetical protein [Streptomyces sp. TX20-6-3]
MRFRVAASIFSIISLAGCGAINVEAEIRNSPEGKSVASYVTAALKGDPLDSHYGTCSGESDKETAGGMWKEARGSHPDLTDFTFDSSTTSPNSSSINLVIASKQGGEGYKIVVHTALEDGKWVICSAREGHVTIDADPL